MLSRLLPTSIARWFPRNVSPRTVSRRRGTLGRAVESLEARQLFAVSLNTPLDNFSVTSGAYPSVIDLSTRFSSTTISGTTVRFALEFGGARKNVDIELFDTATPKTVENFLKYITAGTYNSTFFHRSVTDFVVQGGGYNFNASRSAVTKFGTVDNEFTTSPRDDSGGVNIRGTVAMAKKGGDPNSADSEFFFNVKDNSANLDNNNGGFTTFARVLGSGMSIVDEINDLPIGAPNLASPFDEIPTSGYSASAGLLQSNVVFVNSAAKVAPVSFAATSSNISLVTPNLSEDGKLVLTYQPNVTGTATITIVSTDLNGDALTSTFNISVTGGSNVSVSFNDVRIDPTGATPVAFGAITPNADNPVTRQFVLRNTGSETLTNLTFTLPDGFTLLGTAPTTLESGEAPTITVAIDSSASGDKAGTFTISSPGSGTPTFSIPLSANIRLPVTLGSGGVKSVRFTQGTGSAATQGTFTLTGPGTSAFSFSGTGLTTSVQGSTLTVTGNASVATINFTSTTKSSSLKLSAQGDQLIEIASVTSTGVAVLGVFDARKARLVGSFTWGSTLTTNAYIKSIALGQVSGASVVLGSSTATGAALTFVADRVENAVIVSQYPIKSITVNTWTTPGTDGRLQTTGLGTLTIKSDFATSVFTSGNLVTANIKGEITGGRWSVGGSLASLTAGGVRNGFTLQAAGEIRTIRTQGAFSGSATAQSIGRVSGRSSDGATLVAAGGTNDPGTIKSISFNGPFQNGFINAKSRIGTFSSTALRASSIYAGTTVTDSTTLPANASAFSTSSRIDSVYIAGSGVNFSNSIVSARYIGYARAGRIQTAAANTNGFAADFVRRFLGITDIGQLVSQRDISSQASLPTLFSTTGSLSTFKISIL